MKPTLSFLVLASLVLTSAHAQDVFLHAAPGNIYKLESDYSLTLVASETYSSTFGIIGDIAISPDQHLYGIGFTGEIITIDWVTGVTTVITQLPGYYYNSLTCSADYILYTLTDLGDLYAYNLVTDSTRLIAHIGESTPGDLTFYRGNIIFQSFADGHIKAYNLTNSSLTTILCRESPLTDTVGLWGMANAFADCDAGRIFASDNASNLFELHPEQGTIEHLAYYDYLSFPQDYDIYGMASDNEYLSSQCSHQFTEVDCNASATNEATNTDLLLYPNPTSHSFQISANMEFSKVVVLDATGRVVKRMHTQHDGYDISELPGGIYFVNIFGADEMSVGKVMKY